MSSSKSYSQGSGKAKVYGAAIGKVGDALNKNYEQGKKQTAPKISLSRQYSTGSDANKNKNRPGSLMRQTSSNTQQKNKDKKTTTGTRV